MCGMCECPVCQCMPHAANGYCDGEKILGGDPDEYPPDCVYCGDTGVLNVEAILVEDLDREFSEDYWTPELSWCHGCPRGLEWKEILNG